MGLDAVVYCNCYELGKLREPPPDPKYVYVDYLGNVEWNVSLWEQQHSSKLTEAEQKEYQQKRIGFDIWHHQKACEHPDNILIHHITASVTSQA